MKNHQQTGYIYTLSDPDNGAIRYVGQTVNIEKRYGLHIFHSKNGRARTHKEKWINTLVNNGKKPILNVIWEGDKNLLDEKEIYFISQYKSLGTHLTNATNGGLTTSGRKCSESTKQLLSSMMKGKCLRPPISEAERSALSKRRKGVPMPEEQKEKIRQSRKGVIPNRDYRLISKQILAIKDGEQKLYQSTLAAEKATGCDRKTMRQVANGVYKQCKGYVFKYQNL